MTAGADSSALSALIERRLYLHPVVLLTSFGRLNEFRGGRAPLRPAERSARACCVDRPPALFYSKLTHCPRIRSVSRLRIRLRVGAVYFRGALWCKISEPVSAL